MTYGNSHLMVVSPDRKGEAAFDRRSLGIVRVLQGAAGQQRLLGLIERNRPELLPVVHQGLLGEDLVERDLALCDY